MFFAQKSIMTVGENNCIGSGHVLLLCFGYIGGCGILKILEMSSSGEVGTKSKAGSCGRSAEGQFP